MLGLLPVGRLAAGIVRQAVSCKPGTATAAASAALPPAWAMQAAGNSLWDGLS